MVSRASSCGVFDRLMIGPKSLHPMPNIINIVTSACVYTFGCVRALHCIVSRGYETNAPAVCGGPEMFGPLTVPNFMEMGLLLFDKSQQVKRPNQQIRRITIHPGKGSKSDINLDRNHRRRRRSRRRAPPHQKTVGKNMFLAIIIQNSGIFGLKSCKIREFC